MIIRCIIVDDEQPARDELRYLLSSFDDIEIVGDVGSVGKAVMLVEKSSPDLVFLDILVGVVFILGPAKLLSNLTGVNIQILVACIFFYYFIAIILPIDKVIGRLYPLFGALLIFMIRSLANHTIRSQVGRRGEARY